MEFDIMISPSDRSIYAATDNITADLAHRLATIAHELYGIDRDKWQISLVESLEFSFSED